jgi:transcriptional regulator with XRE-family HTH domain
MRTIELTLGERLRYARQHARLEQTQLATLLGLSRQSISNYERDQRRPSKAVLLAWSIETDTPQEWIREGVLAA